MTLRRASSLAAVLVVVFLCGCSSEEPSPPPPTGPTTAEEIHDKCRAWAEVGCRKNDECVGISTGVEECTAVETQKCVDDTNAERASCHRPRVNALDRCTDDLEGETCEQYCGNDDFCFYYCPYFC
jgi:hypothetical protein